MTARILVVDDEPDLEALILNLCDRDIAGAPPSIDLAQTSALHVCPGGEFKRDRSPPSRLLSRRASPGADG